MCFPLRVARPSVCVKVDCCCVGKAVLWPHDQRCLSEYPYELVLAGVHGFYSVTGSYELVLVVGQYGSCHLRCLRYDLSASSTVCRPIVNLFSKHTLQGSMCATCLTSTSTSTLKVARPMIQELSWESHPPHCKKDLKSLRQQ